MNRRSLILAPVRALAVVLALLGAPTPGASAATVPVPAGGDLQAALAAAQPGDVLLLDPGATYTGNFVLPAKTGDDEIVVRTALPADRQPRRGTRIGPDSTLPLARIVSPTSEPAIATAPRAHHWRLQWLEITSTRDNAADLVTLGDGSSAQRTLDVVPHHLVVEQCYIHGAPGGQKRGIALNSASTRIADSSIVDIKGVGLDTQAIASWNGPGPYTIENNLLEGAGENLLFGGADPAIWNLVPADIVVRHNLLRKPVEWRGQKWQVKNLFELKNARRVLVDGNILENNWRHAQPGYAVLFNPRNQEGKAPWATVEDVTFSNNILRHVGGAFNVTGTDDVNPSGSGRRIRIVNNLVYDVSADAWGGSGHFLLIGHGAADVVVEHNTVQHTGNFVQAYGRRNGKPLPMTGFVLRDNLAAHNKYGIMGDSASPGQGTLAAFFPEAIVQCNVLAGGSSNRYPAGNLFPSVTDFEAQFANAAAGDFSLVAGSRWAAAATDGVDIGVEFNALNAAQHGADQGGRLKPAPTGVAAPPAVSRRAGSWRRG